MIFKNLKMKTTYLFLVLGVFGLLFGKLPKSDLTIWIQAAGVLLFFYGMMRLMSKVSSNSKKDDDAV